MTQELTTFEGKQPIVMKGGLVHWVSEETASKMQAQLISQTSHAFVKLVELGIVINTAQVEGVYTMRQYEDVLKIKQGMYQCEYQNWHKKKEECECKKDAHKKWEQDRAQRERDEENRPRTPEEKERSRIKMTQMRSELQALGILKKVKR